MVTPGTVIEGSQAPSDEENLEESQEALAGTADAGGAGTEGTSSEALAEEVDWEVRARGYESELASVRKQVDDLRSNEISHLTAAERDRLSQRTAKTLDVLLETMAEQGYDGLQEKLQKVQQESETAAVTAGFEQRAREVTSEVGQLAADLGVRVEDEPAFATARQYWAQAHEAGNPYFLERALSEAHRAVTKITKTQATTAAAKAKAQATEDTKAALTRVGAKDLDAGEEAGGGEQSWRSKSATQKMVDGAEERRAQG